MNNFCTRCGTKLESHMLTCPNCNLAIVDDSEAPEIIEKRKEQNKKIRNTIFKILLIIIIAYFSINFIRHTYNILDLKSNIKNLLPNQNNYKIKITNITHCKECTSSCDGSCFNYKMIPNCYIYSFEIIFDNKVIISTSAEYTLSKKTLPNAEITEKLKELEQKNQDSQRNNNENN